MNNVIEIVGDNYFGSYKYTRYACRGVIIKDNKILLSYATKMDVWMIPGGGVEKGETYVECVARELREETGYIVVPEKHTLTLVEYYEDVRYVSFYFICKVVGETDIQLTEAEIEGGLEKRWVPLKEALSIFSKHEDYRNIFEEKRGAYLRDYTALSETALMR